MTELSLKNKVVVITGASRGIGMALAKQLLDEECLLALCARTAPDLHRPAAPGAVLTGSCDVADPESVERFFLAVKRDFGHIDFLINNAGRAHEMNPVAQLPVEVWQQTVNINLTGPFLCSRAALPMMGRGGMIVNVLSVAAQRVFTGLSAYSAAKHGALGLTNTMREELRSEGIRVLAMIPGATGTDIWEQFMPKADRGGMMRPETVASTIVQAMKTPADATMEEIRMTPLIGTITNRRKS